MIYVLEFLGLLAVALCLAAGPLLINVLERFFSLPYAHGASAAGHASSDAASRERAEVRDEIRRVTDILERRQA